MARQDTLARYMKAGEQQADPSSYVVLDPSNIRSRFAAFNPALKDSPNLLAGLGGAAVGAGALMAPDKAEAGPNASLNALKRAAQDRMREHRPLAPAAGLATLKELANPLNLLPLSMTSRELDRPEDLQYIDGRWLTPRQAAAYGRRQ